MHSREELIKLISETIYSDHSGNLFGVEEVVEKIIEEQEIAMSIFQAIVKGKQIAFDALVQLYKENTK